METVIRNVGDIDARDRQALEHVLGQPLHENQQLVIGIRDVHGSMKPAQRTGNGTATLPEWCNVFAGLSDGEIDDLEKAILPRADLSRPSE
jgi:hypothetical protein